MRRKHKYIPYGGCIEPGRRIYSIWEIVRITDGYAKTYIIDRSSMWAYFTCDSKWSNMLFRGTRSWSGFKSVSKWCSIGDILGKRIRYLIEQ